MFLAERQKTEETFFVTGKFEGLVQRILKTKENMHTLDPPITIAASKAVVRRFSSK